MTVATSRFAVAAGRRTTVPITLNATGKRLLNRFYSLPTRMRLTGTPSLARTVRFRYVVIDASVNFHFESNSSSGVTSVTGLTPTALPHRARVELLCHGRGCPFSKHVLIARAALIRLAGQFRGAELHPGAVVQLIITAPFSVGEVHIVTSRATGPDWRSAASRRDRGARSSVRDEIVQLQRRRGRAHVAVQEGGDPLGDLGAVCGVVRHTGYSATLL